EGGRRVGAESPQQCCERHDDDPILRPSKYRATPRYCADDAAGLPQDIHLRADRIEMWEEVGGDVGANQADRLVLALLGFAVEAAGVDLDPLDLEHTCCQPPNLHTAGYRAPPFDATHDVRLRPYVSALAAGVADGYVVLVFDALPFRSLDVLVDVEKVCR